MARNELGPTTTPTLKRIAIRRLAAALAVSATFAAGAAAVSRPADAAATQPGQRPWFTSCAQSQQHLAPTVLHNQSVRMITHLSQPNSILPAYDTGDGVHANIAGQQAIADYVSLPMIAR